MISVSDFPRNPLGSKIDSNISARLENNNLATGYQGAPGAKGAPFTQLGYSELVRNQPLKDVIIWRIDLEPCQMAGESTLISVALLRSPSAKSKAALIAGGLSRSTPKHPSGVQLHLARNHVTIWHWYRPCGPIFLLQDPRC